MQSERARVEATLAAGCDGYVEKPLRREHLIEIVRARLADAEGSAGTEVKQGEGRRI